MVIIFKIRAIKIETQKANSPYPRIKFCRDIGDISLRPGRSCATSLARKTFAPSTQALLRVLSVASCGLFLRMRLHTIDSTHDISNNQWAASVPCDYLFDLSFSFLQTLVGVISISLARVIQTINEGTWLFPFKPCPLDL